MKVLLSISTSLLFIIQVYCQSPLSGTSWYMKNYNSEVLSFLDKDKFISVGGDGYTMSLGYYALNDGKGEMVFRSGTKLLMQFDESTGTLKLIPTDERAKDPRFTLTYSKAQIEPLYIKLPTNVLFSEINNPFNIGTKFSVSPVLSNLLSGDYSHRDSADESDKYRKGQKLTLNPDGTGTSEYQVYQDDESYAYVGDIEKIKWGLLVDGDKKRLVFPAVGYLQKDKTLSLTNQILEELEFKVDVSNPPFGVLHSPILFIEYEDGQTSYTYVGGDSSDSMVLFNASNYLEKK